MSPPLAKEVRTRMYRVILRTEWLEVWYISTELNGRANQKPLALFDGAETAQRLFNHIYREQLTKRGDAFVSGLVASFQALRSS